MTMRVGLETSWLSGPGAIRGVGRYVTEVMAACQANGIEIEALSERGPSGHAFHPGYIRRIRRRASEFDLFHAPTPLFDYVRLPIPTVCTFLDAIQLEVAAYSRYGPLTRIAMKRAARSDAILTISAYSASVLVDRLDIDPSRITIAPLPVARAFLEDPDAERVPCPHGPGCVVAYADHSRPDPRKRYEWLIPVAVALGRAGGHLCVIGRSGPSGSPHLLEGTGKAIMRGPLPDEELREVLRSAEFLCFPSAYEGQGMPPLEALAVGTPVVAFANTSIPEVVGEYGVLVEEVEPDPRVAANGPHRPDDEGAIRLADACVQLVVRGTSELSAVISAGDPLAEVSRERFAAGIRTAYTMAVQAKI